MVKVSGPNPVFSCFEPSLKGFVVDPSFLALLMVKEVVLDEDTRVFVPDCLDNLIKRSQKEQESKDCLLAILEYFSDFRRSKSEGALPVMYARYRNLKKQISIVKISDIDLDVYGLRMVILKNLRSRKADLIRDIVGKVLGFSKKRNIPILTKTRKLFYLMREHIVLIEIPKQLNKVLKLKQDLGVKVFKFKHGIAVKFFLGVFTTIQSSHPVSALVGYALMFMDP